MLLCDACNEVLIDEAGKVYRNCNWNEWGLSCDSHHMKGFEVYERFKEGDTVPKTHQDVRGCYDCKDCLIVRTVAHNTGMPQYFVCDMVVTNVRPRPKCEHKPGWGPAFRDKIIKMSKKRRKRN